MKVRASSEGVILPPAIWPAVGITGTLLGIAIAGTPQLTIPTIEWILMCTAALAALAVGIRSPFHAFCLLVVTLPFENALVFTSVFTITPAHLALLLMIAVCAWYAPRRRIVGRLSSPLHRFVLVYLGMSFLSIAMTIVAPPPTGAAGASTGWRATELRTVIQICLLLFMSLSYFATVYFCSTQARLKQVMTIYLATATLIALYGLYQVVATIYYLPLVANLVRSYFGIASSFRPNATFREPLNFGHYLLTALPLAITLFLHHNRLRGSDRMIWGVGLLPAIVVMAAALLATIARGAWFGFIGAMGVMMFLSVRIGGHRVVVRALVLAAVVCVVAIVATAQAYSSLQEMYTVIANRFAFSNPVNVAAEQRLPFIPFLFGLWRRYPVLGVGYGNYPLYQLDSFGGGIAGAYGLYFQALVESGVLGLGALLAMIGAYYVTMWRALERASATEWWPWLAGSACAFTGLMIQYFTFGDRFGMYAWVFIGLSMAMVNVVNDEIGTRA
ncbi:MAG TPA: O-antigen ligase family protein [Vicinamibacterales bacterium]|nr:O-antigen ligase family protein [Vicinamibacterales bacterium]